MAFIVVDNDNEEFIFSNKPTRDLDLGWWVCTHRIRAYRMNVKLPKGTIEKLIGKKLTWEDEPVELKEQISFEKGGYIENSHIYVGDIKC